MTDIEWQGMMLGVAVISASIICGAILIFASMRSGQITKQEREKEGEDGENFSRTNERNN